MKYLAIAAATAIGLTGVALADEAKGPTVMTDAQMEQIVAGDFLIYRRNTNWQLFRIEDESTDYYKVLAGEADVSLDGQPPHPFDQGMCNGAPGHSGYNC